MSDILRSEAVANYLNALYDFIPGEDGALKFEVFKVEIADLVLKELGLPTQPNWDRPGVNWDGEPRLPKLEYKPQKLPSGFVYLAKNNRNGLFKIGFSKTPELREKTLQSEEPEIEFVGVWPGNMADEARLHLMFNEKRVRGEWFKLSDQDVHAATCVASGRKISDEVEEQ